GTARRWRRYGAGSSISSVRWKGSRCGRARVIAWAGARNLGASAGVWHHRAAMVSSADPVRVLEWVRYPSGVWNLPREFPPRIRAEFAPLAPVQVLSPATRDEADALLPDADVVLGLAVRPANFARCRRLKWIHSTAASVTGVLFPELAASPVVVTNARGLHAESMAEHALAMMLAFARRLHVSRDAQRLREW